MGFCKKSRNRIEGRPELCLEISQCQEVQLSMWFDAGAASAPGIQLPGQGAVGRDRGDKVEVKWGEEQVWGGEEIKSFRYVLGFKLKGPVGRPDLELTVNLQGVSHIQVVVAHPGRQKGRREV